MLTGKVLSRCFELFRGYKNILFEGLVCSSSCASLLQIKWDQIIKEETRTETSVGHGSSNNPDVLSIDVINDDTDLHDSQQEEQFCFDVPDVDPPPHTCNLCRRKRHWLLCH